MVSHTPATDFLNMTMIEQDEMRAAIRAVVNAAAERKLK